MVKEFGFLCFQFANKLDFDELISKGFQRLIKAFNKAYLSQPGITLSQLVQIWVNFSNLSKAVSNWNEYFSYVCYRGEFRLSPTLFDSAKSQTETMINSLIKKKIEDFFGIAESTLNWNPSSSTNQCRDYAHGNFF